MKLRARRRDRMHRALAQTWRWIVGCSPLVAVDLGRPGGDETCEVRGRLLKGEIVEIQSMVFR